ncbi:MAG: hypothetical protein KDC80_21040 [Saprospiraceae bacterium]|nr:hypothetical protein [Saprospiraceae bacterium]
MNRSRLWTFCRLAVALIVILIFTPLVIPAHQSDPFLLGMPYSLWMGLLVSFVLLALTILGSLVHPGRD